MGRRRAKSRKAAEKAAEKAAVQLEAQKLLQTAQLEAEMALGLLSQETADEIIGKPGDEHGALIKGVRGAFALMMAVFHTLGLRRVPQAFDAAAKGQAMMLTLVHYAYALGVKRGRAEAGEGRLDQEE